MPTVQEIQLWSLGQEDPLEKRMQTMPVFLPGGLRGQRTGRLQSIGCRVRHDWAAHTHTHTHTHTLDLVAYKQEKIVSHSSGGWKVEDQGARRLGIYWEPTSWFIVTFCSNFTCIRDSPSHSYAET